MRQRTGITRRLTTLVAAAALATLGLVAVGMTAAHATTSVEGNCMATVTPLATPTDDGVNTSITVTWTDECTNNTGDNTTWNIERSSDGGTTWDTIVTGLTFPRLLSPPHQDGTYTDSNLPCGTYIYRVVAVHSPGNALPKISISKDSNSVTVTISEDCGGGGGTGECNQLTGAMTLGFYSNKNGQATISTGELSTLSGQFLVNYAGADQTWSAYGQFKNWLLNATAKNMSYMLSAQVATLELNISNGFLTGDEVLCEVDGNPTIQDVVDAALAYIIAHPQVLGGDAARADGDALETLIDEINNDLVTVQ